MILISAIGNNDKKYNRTRHNAGFMFLKMVKAQLKEGGFYLDDNKREFKEKKGCDSEILEFRWGPKVEIIASKNLGYMNTSGRAVKKLYDNYNINLDEFILVHDDLDLPLGEYKIQRGKSPHGHNGVNSVEESLGEKDFWRVRIGIENREEKTQIPGEKYVIQRFSKEEMEVLNSVFVEATEQLLCFEIFERWL